MVLLTNAWLPLCGWSLPSRGGAGGGLPEGLAVQCEGQTPLVLQMVHAADDALKGMP